MEISSNQYIHSFTQATATNNATKIENNTKSEKPEFKNIPGHFLHAIYDDSNTFGLFLSQNDKAMKSLDNFLENMDENEKLRFVFVFGHVGDEHLLKAMYNNGLSSPTEAIPYVQNEIASFSNNSVFAESLQSMYIDKPTEKRTATDKLLEKFYESYTNSFTPIDIIV